MGQILVQLARGEKAHFHVHTRPLLRDGFLKEPLDQNRAPIDGLAEDTEPQAAQSLSPQHLGRPAE